MVSKEAVISFKPLASELIVTIPVDAFCRFCHIRLEPCTCQCTRQPSWYDYAGVHGFQQSRSLDHLIRPVEYSPNHTT